MLTPNQLTSLHRRQQLTLRRTVIVDLARLWPRLRWAELDASYPLFAEAVSRLVTVRRRTSTGLAAAYLRAFRVASGLPGEVRMISPELDLDQFATSLEVTSKIAVKKSAGRGVEEHAAMAAALSLASGAMARLVLNGGRETLTATAKTDPKAAGWRRVLGMGGCDFCRGLAGLVVDDETSIDCHDGCGCTAEIVYESSSRL